jgi:hypothetical protein
MGDSAVVVCDSCDFEAGVTYGVGMARIELLPCVCRACQHIVTIERIYTWTDPSGAKPASDAELAEMEQQLGVPLDPPLVCPECNRPVKPLLRDDETGVASVVEPCPKCGNVLRTEWGGLLWD